MQALALERVLEVERALELGQVWALELELVLALELGQVRVQVQALALERVLALVRELALVWELRLVEPQQALRGGLVFYFWLSLDLSWCRRCLACLLGLRRLVFRLRLRLLVRRCLLLLG